MRERSQNESIWVLCRGTRHTRHLNQQKPVNSQKRENNRLLVLRADKMRDICNERSAWER